MKAAPFPGPPRYPCAVAVQLSLFESESPAGPPSPPGRVLVARGALAAEAVVLDRLAGFLDEARRDPSLLVLPVRVVVPSRSLRAHLGSAIVRARGRSVAGLSVQTLHGLALEILERAGETAPRGLPLSEILAQRHAAREPSLRAGLGDLVDGYGGVASTARDLLDAGLEMVHAEPALEALSLDGPYVASRAAVERARALVRVAARTEEEMGSRGLGAFSSILRRAGELLETDPERVLPARAVVIHGFADATGVAADLLQSLLRRRRGWLVLDRPPAWQGEGVEGAFTERLVARLSPVAQTDEAEPAPLETVAPPRVERFQAPGAGAEVREVAGGSAPCWTREPGPRGSASWRATSLPTDFPCARHLAPARSPVLGRRRARGALGPAGRRTRAFLEVLRRGEEVPAERWLDAVAGIEGVRFVDLRLAFASLGAGRLRDVAVLRPELFLRPESDSFPLPIRHGLRAGSIREGEEADPDEAAGEVRAVRRHVKGERIRAAVRLAGRVRERLAGWPEEATAGEHLSRLRALLVQDLGWREGEGPVFEALEALGREVPERFTLDRDELRRLLAGELEEAGTADLGGLGGGVQVLSAMEARGRTFEHLFLIGLNRDVFPRGVREDPLLPDDLRRVIQRVLPDVPVKLAGFDEERWLFAHLLSASPAVTLSWQGVDEDGKALSPSPLLRERGEVVKVPALWLAGGGGAGSEDGGGAGGAGGVARAAERAGRGAWKDPPSLSRRRPPRRPGGARSRPPHSRRPGGALPARPVLRLPRPPSGARRKTRGGASSTSPIWKTLAACPWQLFLQRLLKLEPTPDPLEWLPGSDPLLLGNLAHADRWSGSSARGGRRCARRRPRGAWPARSPGCWTSRHGSWRRRGSSCPAWPAPWRSGSAPGSMRPARPTGPGGRCPC